MANAREIQGRIKSIKDTMKITNGQTSGEYYGGARVDVYFDKEDTDTDQILANLYDFIEEFNHKYGEEIEGIDINEIIEALKD